MTAIVPLIDYIRTKAVCTETIFDVRPHHLVACDAVERCLSGTLPDGKRHLIINLPPRFSKTSIVEGAVEWGTGYLSDSEWIYSSAAEERAVESAKKIKETMRSPWYNEMYPLCNLKRDRGSDGSNYKFYTDRGGAVYAVGASGQVIGFGAGKRRPGFGGAFIWDDPLKAVQARSEKGREGANNFFKETIQTRFNSNGTPLILIMQRLHPDDPCGMLMQDYPELIHRVVVPALKDDDTAEWEEAKSAKELKLMREVDPFTFYTQYQQEPIQPGGTIIKTEWWHWYNDKEEVLRRCNGLFITADTAAKKNPKNDHSVIQVWGFEEDKRLYLIDQLRGKWEFPELIQNVKMVWEKWSAWDRTVRATRIFIEDKSSGISLIQTLQRENINVVAWAPQDYGTDQDKVSRVRDSSYMIYGGRVWIPDEAICPWINKFEKECSMFTNDDSHSSDDQVDTMTMAVLTWKHLGGGMG